MKISQFDAARAVSHLQYHDPNLKVISDQVISIIKNNLPAMIAEMNSTFGLSIPMPEVKKIFKAPADIGDKFINTILIQLNMTTESQSPRNFTNYVTIRIHWIAQRLQLESQVDEFYQKGAAIRGVMYEYLVNCENEDGYTIWNNCLPGEYKDLPEEFADYFGITVESVAQIDPGHRLWSVTP